MLFAVPHADVFIDTTVRSPAANFLCGGARVVAGVVVSNSEGSNKAPGRCLDKTESETSLMQVPSMMEPGVQYVLPSHELNRIVAVQDRQDANALGNRG